MYKKKELCVNTVHRMQLLATECCKLYTKSQSNNKYDIPYTFLFIYWAPKSTSTINKYSGHFLTKLCARALWVYMFAVDYLFWFFDKWMHCQCPIQVCFDKCPFCVAGLLAILSMQKREIKIQVHSHITRKKNSR